MSGILDCSFYFHRMDFINGCVSEHLPVLIDKLWNQKLVTSFFILNRFLGFFSAVINKGNFWNSKNLVYLKELNDFFQIIYKTFGCINTTLQMEVFLISLILPNVMQSRFCAGIIILSRNMLVLVSLQSTRKKIVQQLICVMDNNSPVRYFSFGLLCSYVSGKNQCHWLQGTLTKIVNSLTH